MNKTCFVISPIGDKGTEIRSRADLLYDLIIEPALEKFGFDVTRADKTAAVASITSEIIQLVQDSGLCIIDITGHNPNVMYECGRRHETAKPYIMMAEEGEKLPFDITTIRTVFYNLKDAREIRNTVKTLQTFIEKMLADGLQPVRSGESLSTLSDSLNRIERKIDRLSVASPTSAGGAAGNAPQEYKDILSSLGLTGAFNYALQERDIGLMDYLIPSLERQVSREKFIDLVLTQAAPNGSRLAHQKLEAGFNDIDSLEPKLQRDYIASLVSGYNIQDREREGLELLRSFFERIAETPAPSDQLSTKDKAFYLNQHQRLLHGNDELEAALEMQKRVLALSPDDRSYIYNFGLICEELEKSNEACEAAKKLWYLTKDRDRFDDDHLYFIVRMFAKFSDPLRHEVFAKLKEVNPYRATMLLRDRELRVNLGA